MISYKQLVKKTMPPEKAKTASRCIISHYLLRPISNVISIPFIEKDVDPTAVTKFSGLFPIIAFFAFMFLTEPLGFWTGWICIFIWNILDGVDGNIARYNDRCSLNGDLWDATVGWIAVMVYYYGMGFCAMRVPGWTTGILETIPPYGYLFMGGMAAMTYFFPRLIMYRKASTEGKKPMGALKRENYGFVKLVVFNITSINGLGAVIFLLAHILHLNAICMIFYFVINLMICCASLYLLLKKEVSEE